MTASEPPKIQGSRRCEHPRIIALQLGLKLGAFDSSLFEFVRYTNVVIILHVSFSHTF